MFQLTLGATLTASQGYGAPDVERVYARARALCHQLGETPQLFPALWGLYAFNLVRGHLPQALELAEQLLQLAQRIQALQLMAHRELGVTLFYLGELALARAHLEQALALYEPGVHRRLVVLYGSDPRIHCLAYLARVLGLLGYPAQALARMQDALTLAQALEHPFSLALTLYLAAALHQDRGEAEAVQQQAEAAIALATAQGFPHWVARATVVRGWALVHQGRDAEGVAQMCHGLTACQAGGAELALPLFFGLLAEGQGHSGQAAEGLTSLAEAWAVIQRTGERWCEAELSRLQGELLWQQAAGNMHQMEWEAEVEHCFRQALTLARGQQAKWLELRAAMA